MPFIVYVIQNKSFQLSAPKNLSLFLFRLENKETIFLLPLRQDIYIREDQMECMVCAVRLAAFLLLVDRKERDTRDVYKGKYVECTTARQIQRQ